VILALLSSQTKRYTEWPFKISTVWLYHLLQHRRKDTAAKCFCIW